MRFKNEHIDQFVVRPKPKATVIMGSVGDTPKKRIIKTAPSILRRPRDAIQMGDRDPNQQAPSPAETGYDPFVLQVANSLNVPVLNPGRGAPLELRFVVASLLHLRYEHRDGHWYSYKFDLESVAKLLWGTEQWNRGTISRANIVGLFQDSLTEKLYESKLSSTGELISDFIKPIHWIPEHRHFEVMMRCPGDLKDGAKVDFPTLVEYGKDSSPLYRGYLVAEEIKHTSARNGHAKTRLMPDGSPNDTKYNPWFDMTSWVSWLGMDPTNDQHRRRASKALARLKHDGIIDLEQDRHPKPNKFKIWGARILRKRPPTGKRK